MSNTQFAFISKDSVPSREQLQESIEKLGFDLKLDPEFTPFDDEGFSPCVLNGEEDVGYEIYYEPAKEVVEGDEKFSSIADNKDYCISMCWGGSLKDCACVMIVGCALNKEFGAIISYEGEDPEPLDKMISDTKAIIKEAEVEERRQEEADITIEKVKKSGNIKELVNELLNSIAGTSVSNIALYGSLAIPFSNGIMIRAKAFSCVKLNGEIIDVTRYSQVRAEQIVLIHEGTEEEFSPEQQKRLDELEPQVERAMEADEKNSELFLKELESWPEELLVGSVEWPENDKIVLRFSNVPNAYIEMRTFDSIMADINIRSQLLEFKISPGECEIME